MKTVYKFPLNIENEQYVEMKSPAEIVYVAMQNGGLFIWAIVETDGPVTLRRILICGTG